MVAYEFSIAPVLLLLLAGVIMLPPLAKISDDKFKTTRITRNVIVAVLMFTAFYLIGQHELDSDSSYIIIEKDKKK